MKARTIQLSLACVLFAAEAVMAKEPRTWTSRTGTTLDAEFVRVKFNAVYLKTDDGAVKKIDIRNLSPSDQAWIKQQNQPMPEKKEEAEQKASKALRELFGDTLRDSRKHKVPIDSLAGKTIAIYFSAHWCPPCRAFTPKLVDFHNQVAGGGKPLEIVFVSSDHGESEMYRYMEAMDMPWLAVDYDQFQLGLIKSKFEIRGIPALIIINDQGEVVARDGRRDVSELGAAAFDKWRSN